MQNIIDKYQITMETVEVPVRPDIDWCEGGSHFLVTLRSKHSSMSFFYSQGAAHRVWGKNVNSNMPCYNQFKPKPGKATPAVLWSSKKTLHNEIRQHHTVPTPLSLADVLESLAMDASCTEPRFEDWAEGMGYDTDSRKAEAIYKTCLAIELDMKDLLTTEGLNELLRVEL